MSACTAFKSCSTLRVVQRDRLACASVAPGRTGTSQHPRHDGRAREARGHERQDRGRRAIAIPHSLLCVFSSKAHRPLILSRSAVLGQQHDRHFIRANGNLSLAPPVHERTFEVLPLLLPQPQHAAECGRSGRAVQASSASWGRKKKNKKRKHDRFPVGLICRGLAGRRLGLRVDGGTAGIWTGARPHIPGVPRHRVGLKRRVLGPKKKRTRACPCRGVSGRSLATVGANGLVCRGHFPALRRGP